MEITNTELYLITLLVITLIPLTALIIAGDLDK
jgi:hypothetical protein